MGAFPQWFQLPAFPIVPPTPTGGAAPPPIWAERLFDDSEREESSIAYRTISPSSNASLILILFR